MKSEVVSLSDEKKEVTGIDRKVMEKVELESDCVFCVSMVISD